MKDGEADDELTLSAYRADSSELFPRILDLHVDDGARIADVTHGTGVFWQDIDLDARDMELVTSDITAKTDDLSMVGDCRAIPLQDNSLDCIILDPPYAEGFYRRNKDHMAGHGSHESFRDTYSGAREYEGAGRYHSAVLYTYFEGGKEAKRVLRDDGLLIIKIMDEVSSNTQELAHIQVTNYYERELDFYTRDLFIQVRKERPTVVGMKSQIHARKNHSYFLVYDMP